MFSKYLNYIPRKRRPANKDCNFVGIIFSLIQFSYPCSCTFDDTLHAILLVHYRNIFISLSIYIHNMYICTFSPGPEISFCISGKLDSNIDQYLYILTTTSQLLAAVVLLCHKTLHSDSTPNLLLLPACKNANHTI